MAMLGKVIFWGVLIQLVLCVLAVAGAIWGVYELVTAHGYFQWVSR